MQEVEIEKHYYFVDESGDPIFFDRKGNDLVKNGGSSPVFMVGFIDTEKMNDISRHVTEFRQDIMSDSYLLRIPSISKSLVNFHAKDDCPEVREKVFKCIKQLDFKTQIIVARKDPDKFRKKFNGEAKSMYGYLVSKLFENRLHLHSNIDMYFSKMGNIVREQNMRSALNSAKDLFKNKWGIEHSNEMRIFIQEPSQIAALQVVDYMLWAVYRAYTKGEMRYFEFVREKYSLIVDIFDTEKYPKNYYTDKNGFDIKKISPLVAR
jgi:hypothetical protein